MDAALRNNRTNSLPILDQVLRNFSETFLKTRGVLAHSFLDLRQVPPDDYLQKWLQEGRHGEMEWMARTAAIRSDISLGFPEYSTALLICVSYDSGKSRKQAGENGISIYAQGRDYHKVLKKLLKDLLREIQEIEPALRGRVFVDTGPLQEKSLGAFAGLGWIGKNTNLISHRYGSLFFLGTLLLNCQCTDFTNPKDHCGTCTRCIEACPTGAITNPYTLDARLCLSYETIERRTPTDGGLLSKGSWIYGCDDCQTCCPYNRFSPPTPIDDFYPRGYSMERFLLLDEEEFLKVFEGSPIRRSGYEHFMENVLAQAVKENERYASLIKNLYQRTSSTRIQMRIEEMVPRLISSRTQK